MKSIKNIIKYILLVAILFSSCSPGGEIYLDGREDDCGDVMVGPASQELSFQVSGGGVAQVFISLRVNELLVGHNITNTGVIDGFYDYTVLWCRVKYDETDNRRLTVFLEENTSDDARSARVCVDDPWGASAWVTIIQESAIPE